MEVTDEQWSAIAPQLPKGKSGPGKRGRPRKDDRPILEGVLWIWRTLEGFAQGISAAPDLPPATW